MIEQNVLESPATAVLLPIPDVGKFTTALITAEIGEVSRFDQHKNSDVIAEYL